MSLINGTAHHQLFNIPTGNVFHKPPKNWKEKNTPSNIAKHKYWKNIFTLLMDEDSIAGRPFWSWFRHKLEEFRKIKLNVDEDLNIHSIFHDKRTELTKRILEGYQLLLYGRCLSTTSCSHKINF